ncbi:uncharacterized protein BCR38DRAFT_232223 [Pseudomassariella vexata]|uniref:RhoGAP domain-containing protein n=1 Tax=Pseudomassariella vexata TaxID=1141098 RepID=A0A1Y2DS16_9PEZI|nr:uncharacterized protein BCR38DRAFT_232223 [Pseudomassariella vexata]ORY62070.1 hypothetical protein BCR38DRAFT_232223 [Pseudomassariella vexata]
MSQLSLQCSQNPPNAQMSMSPAAAPTQDSPTIGKGAHVNPQELYTPAQTQVLSQATATVTADTSKAVDVSAPAAAPPRPLSISTTSARSPRKFTTSPLHISTAISPPTSAGLTPSDFPQGTYDTSVSRITDGALRNPPSPDDNFKRPLVPGTYRQKSPSPPITPAEKIPGTSLAPPPPNDTRSVSDPIVSNQPPAGLPAMAGGSSTSRVEATEGTPRTASIDSTNSNSSSKHSPDTLAGPQEVANLVKAAGSPEAVIQYLLKEKQSQSQQNAQLWRLVDKQRAMILGLNKDLERALKDKEKYRKKMKEVMSAHDDRSKHDIMLSMQSTATIVPHVDVNVPKELTVDVPASPSNPDSDSIKQSPIDMSMAPYPITPPADHMTNSMPSAMGELLDPTHAMPKPQEHALGNFDHEEEDRAAEEAKMAASVPKDLLLDISIPPSRSLPSEPPRMAPPSTAPPKPPLSPTMENLAQFPPPSAPPPRKPPPAPLQLKKDANVAATVSPEDENDSDSDFDSLLEVDEMPLTERRGRRRTREEDDEKREILALQEAEMRSLSKKSKKSSQKETPPKETEFSFTQVEFPSSSQPNAAPSSSMARDNIPSLAGVLSGQTLQITAVPAPMLSPGLPASPRPMGMGSVTSPPHSPRAMGMPAAPLSPRAPRQPIPLPPNTPLSSSSPPLAEPRGLSSPKPLNIVKQPTEADQPSPPASRDSPVERTRVFKGFITDEFPDLLLPPNALPSIDVKVASSRMRPSRASLISLTQLEEDPVFTLAIYSRAQGGELWRVEKDSASLGKLDQRLKQCAAFTAKTPDRALFSGHAPAKLDARRVALNYYLDELLNTPLDIATALELCRYLSTNTLPPNSDDTGTAVNKGVETATQKTGPGGRPFRSGYLTKRGKNFGGWKARFFVLDGPHLRYYETPGGAHLGTIKLQNAQIGKQSQQAGDDSPARGSNDELDNQYRHAFLVLEPKKKDSSSHVKHVLCAESDSERDLWVDALLRWIDYKEPGDEESPASVAHDRQSSVGSSHANGANPKRKNHTQGQGKSHIARASSQEGLIGINYEGTKQGDLPDSVPSRRKYSGTPEPAPERLPPSYTISAPRDPQVISDGSSWGARAGLAPPGPSIEEKKQRKRSFFGFGPKTRPTADDHDALFGGSAAVAPPSNEYRGPIRQVFGAPLADAVRFNGPMDVNVPLPAVVFRCIQYLDAKNAIREEGIFRLSGSNVVIKQLRERFNLEGDVNIVTDETYYDIHAVASLLKLYLRELPTSILTRDLHPQFQHITEMSSHSEKISALGELVQLLPQANGTLLRYLIAFLIKIINHADTNKMTVRNVGIVFSPTLNIPAPVFALLLQNYEGVFGIEPEEYELPSPVSDADSRAPTDQSRRPSTSNAAGSPHRQRLMEQQQRSTPTPPPALMNAGGRAPSAARQLGYEPQYYGQLGNGSQTSLRPAYESYDIPGQARPNPGYDRPLYEQNYTDGSAASYDQPYNKASRRESTMMFMSNGTNLNHQSSKNRLRD